MKRPMTLSGGSMRHNGSSLLRHGLLHSLFCVRLCGKITQSDICLPAFIFNNTYFSKKVFQAFIAVTFYALNYVRVGHIEMCAFLNCSVKPWLTSQKCNLTPENYWFLMINSNRFVIIICIKTFLFQTWSVRPVSVTCSSTPTLWSCWRHTALMECSTWSLNCKLFFSHHNTRKKKKNDSFDCKTANEQV